MIVVLLNEKVVVLLDEQVLPADEFGCLELVEEVVVEVGTLFYQFEFGGVAVRHASIEFPLQEEGHQEPVDADDTVVGTLVKEDEYGDDDGEGSLEDHVHVPEQVEDQFQVDIFELDELRVRYPISAFLGHAQRLGDEFSGEGAFDFDGQFVEETFGVF